MSTPVEALLSRDKRRKARTNRRILEVARRLFPEKGIYWVKIEGLWGWEPLAESM